MAKYLAGWTDEMPEPAAGDDNDDDDDDAPQKCYLSCKHGAVALHPQPKTRTPMQPNPKTLNPEP